MQFKKTIISLLLICSYSFGFAHNLIPHCTTPHSLGNQIETGHHTHDHHAHEEHHSNEKDHSHVKHGDHFDHGFLDYLVCLLEDVHHDDSSCDLECYTPINEYKSSEYEKNQNLEPIIVNSSVVWSFEASLPTINRIVLSGISKLSVKQDPDRGPPAYL